MQSQVKSQLMDAMVQMGDVHNCYSWPQVRTAITEISRAYVCLDKREGQNMDLIEAVRRMDEALTQLHNLAGMLRDRDPARADQIHMWVISLMDLKSELLDDLDQKEIGHD